MYSTIEELFSKLDCRVENECETGDVYLSIIDRQQYPRLWIDNDSENSNIIAETTENMLLRNNPFLEKDWRLRFCGDSITECLNQYNEYLELNKKL